MPAHAARAEIPLEQFYSQSFAPLRGNDFARQQSDNHFREPTCFHAQPDLADVKQLGGIRLQKILVAHEDDLTTAIRMHRIVGHHDGIRGLPQHDAAGTKRR